MNMCGPHSCISIDEWKLKNIYKYMYIYINIYTFIYIYIYIYIHRKNNIKLCLILSFLSIEVMCSFYSELLQSSKCSRLTPWAFGVYVRSNLPRTPRRVSTKVQIVTSSQFGSRSKPQDQKFTYVVQTSDVLWCWCCGAWKLFWLY